MPQPTPQKRQTDLSHFQFVLHLLGLGEGRAAGTEIPMLPATDAATAVFRNSRRVWFMIASVVDAATGRATRRTPISVSFVDLISKR